MTPGYDYVPNSPPITTASGQQDLGFRTYPTPRRFGPARGGHRGRRYGPEKAIPSYTYIG